MREKSVDKIFLGLVITLLVIGVFMFISASLGVLNKDSIKLFYGILRNQLILGLGGGLVAMYLCSKINYKFWKKYAFYIFLLTILLTLLVFIPKLTLKHGGAQRWVSFGPFSFQPVELLKIGFIIYLAGWLSWIKNKVHKFKFGIIPAMIMLAIVSFILWKQPDTKNIILLIFTALAMLIISGARWKHLIAIFLISIIGFIMLASFQPYVRDRIKTFFDPGHDPAGSSYQIEQSLIAVGSGGIMGRGFGQSIQKFSYLPEPQGDSIFAVIGEEFGFIGGIIIIFLFSAFALRGLRIANRAPDLFSRLLTTGIVILFISQAFMNIASTIGVIPLTGVPLVFISHGGTSLLISLAAVGIILNISKYQQESN